MTSGRNALSDCEKNYKKTFSHVMPLKSILDVPALTTDTYQS